MTVFETPILRPFLKLIGWLFLKLLGWKMEWKVPEEQKKYLIIVYPHTSIIDFPLGMAIAFLKGGRIYWMGKDSLFRGPFGIFMRWLGGIAIDRSKANDVVQATIETFNTRDELFITVPPEGTRRYRDYWKSGFYYMALGANVPIAFGYLDYENKRLGIGGIYRLTGEIEKDLDVIRAFYVDKKGRFPERAGDIRIRSKKGGAQQRSC